MSSKRQRRLGITLGDVNGIGPEIALKAAYRRGWAAGLRFVLVGSEDVAAQTARALGLREPSPVSDPGGAHARVNVWNPAPDVRPRVRHGQVRADAGRAAAAWIEGAVEACLDRRLDGLITAPICKEAFHRAGIVEPGHTEMLARLTGARRYAMLLFGGPLKVILATRHVPLARVPEALTRRAVREAIEMAGLALPWLAGRPGRIGVCGLNPHAGDGGLLGDEERRVIAPEVRAARRAGLAVEGPVPADTLFFFAKRGDYDVVVAMYHDQGLAPLKMLAFDRGVNVTLGLPIVRTSPDHGTAFDRAGKGMADPSSMIEAVRWAERLAGRPNPWRS